MAKRKDTAAALLAERRAKGLTALDLPKTPPIYATPLDTAPWDREDGCFAHCDPEGWYSPCRNPNIPRRVGWVPIPEPHD